MGNAKDTTRQTDPHIESKRHMTRQTHKRQEREKTSMSFMDNRTTYIHAPQNNDRHEDQAGNPHTHTHTHKEKDETRKYDFVQPFDFR